ncbi:MAG: tetratricopeptide repeat protein [Desulfatirhabdiaceae bacterium]
MNRICMELILTGFVLLWINGCTLFQKIEPSVIDLPSEPSGIQILPDSSPTDNSYYLYTDARIQWTQGNPDRAITLMEKAVQVDLHSDYLRRELAMMYLQNKKEDRSLEILNELSTRNPNDIDAWIMIGDIHQKQDRVENAVQAYEKALIIDPSRQPVYHALGELYMDSDRLNDAMRIYRQLVERYPESYVAHFYMGKIHTRQEDTKSAEAEFLKTIEIEPDLDEPWIELIALYVKTGRPEAAQQVSERFIRINPDNIRAALLLGASYQAAGQNEKARQLYLNLGQKSETNPDIVKTLVKMYLEPQRFSELTPVVETMLAGAPDNASLHYIAAISHEANENKDQAISHYLKVDFRSQFYENAIMHAMFLFQDTGKTDEALKAITSAIQNTPNVADFYLYLAALHEDAGRFEKAVESIQAGIALDDENDQYYFRLGVVFDKWGKKTDAIEAMKTAIRLNPKNPNTLNYLGYTYADMGKNLDEAEKLILDAMTYKPDDGYITDSLGWVYYQKGDYSRALIYLEKALNLVPDDAAILEHLGDVHQKLNNTEKALEFYRRSLESKGGSPESVKKKIKDLERRGN